MKLLCSWLDGLTRRADRGLRPIVGLDGLRLASTGVALASGVMALAPNAQATVLTAATSSVYINTGSVSTTESTYAQLGGGTGSVAVYPFVALQAQINDEYTQDVFANLDYYFEVVGGSSGTDIPVLIATNLLTSGVYPQYGAATLDVFTGGGVAIAGKTVCTYPGDCAATQFSGNLSVTTTAGTQYRIHLEADAEGRDVFASADPYIFIDPTFAAAADYRVEVSDGVGNSPAAVPTPGTLTLLGSALGLFGLISRCRKRIVPSIG